MACHAHAALCRGLEKSVSERHNPGMCESNTVALYKSNGKTTIETLSGKPWQGSSMGTAWYV
jgi:hypothetical protein